MQTERDNYYKQTEQSTEGRDERKQHDEENPSNLRKLLKNNCKVIIIATVLVIITLITAGNYIYEDYQARQVSHDYIRSFLDGMNVNFVVPMLMDEITKEELDVLTAKTNKIIWDLVAEDQIPKEALKEYNEALRRILGKKKAEEFIVDERWTIDLYGFIDGMTYSAFDYSIMVAYDNGCISDEEYFEYQKKHKYFMKNISHDEAMKMYPYQLKLLDGTFENMQLYESL